jgi:hypothetical protein
MPPGTYLANFIIVYAMLGCQINLDDALNRRGITYSPPSISLNGVQITYSLLRWSFTGKDKRLTRGHERLGREDLVLTGRQE